MHRDPPPPAAPAGPALAELEQVLAGGLLATFQPIVALASGEPTGFEGLVRGPAGSTLETPERLLECARGAGLLVDAELLCAQRVTRAFAAAGAPGLLFVNFSPQTVLSATGALYAVVDFLREIGLPARQVVLELSESQRTLQLDGFRDVLPALRALGFGLAIDDLGEGFSSLRLWSELQPEFVKVDKHFVQGISDEPMKFQFLRAMQSIAEGCGTKLVAEGVEREPDLRLLRDLGVACGQGYLIGRPEPAPRAPAAPAFAALRSRAIAVFPQPPRTSGRTVTAETLLVPVRPIQARATNDEVLEYFEAHPDAHALPVVEGERPVGLINRNAFLARFVRPYRKELYGRRSCAMFMDAEPLVVEKQLSIHELSQTLIGAEQRHLALGFVIVDGGRYLGLGTGQDLIREITQLQIEAARYANPLTLLPGNVPIDEHIERLLAARASFVACYCDLNHFKPFNDAYGYRRGDEMIKLTARVLGEVCEPRRDFLGHIGGDDFMLLLQSPDWEVRCARALAAFERETPGMFAPEDFARGGFEAEDRQGNRVAVPLTTLAIGAVPVAPDAFPSHLDVATAAADAKRQAKKRAGNALFVERRKHT